MKRAIDGAVTAGLAVVIVLGGAVISRAHATPARDSMLVTTEWVAQHLKDADLVLLHVGEKKDYDAAHLPGAQFLPREAFGIRDAEANLTLQVPPVAGARRAARRAGRIGHLARRALLRHRLGDADGARVRDVRLPGPRRPDVHHGRRPAGVAGRAPAGDGGRACRRVRPPHRRVPGPRSSPTSPTCSPTCGTPGTIVVDSRTPEFFAGEKAGSMPRAGRIPGARNIPFSSLVDRRQQAEGRRLAARDLRGAGGRGGQERHHLLPHRAAGVARLLRREVPRLPGAVCTTARSRNGAGTRNCRWKPARSRATEPRRHEEEDDPRVRRDWVRRRLPTAGR